MTGSAVFIDQTGLLHLGGLPEAVLNILVARAVENGGGDVPAQRLGGQTQMHLQHLTDVHSGGNAQRVQHDVQRACRRA